jgi:hypothetical protein
MCSRAAGLRLRLREAARLQLVRLVVICKYVVQFRLRPRPLSRVRVLNKKEMRLWNSIADGGKMSMLRGSDPRCVRSGRVVSDLNGYYDSQNIIAVPIRLRNNQAPVPASCQHAICRRPRSREQCCKLCCITHITTRAVPG